MSEEIDVLGADHEYDEESDAEEEDSEIDGF
jgi:hypothetical protein